MFQIMAPFPSDPELLPAKVVSGPCRTLNKVLCIPKLFIALGWVLQSHIQLST
jgi:hypothetical protein